MKITEFCDKLKGAEARFEFVIAVFCDIRSFSSFSKTVESSDTSTFLKHFYLKLLSNYFQDAVFAKPTGDGLLIVFRHGEKNLAQMSELVFSKCFKALKDFPQMFRDIPILNYPPPEAIGFGIARGSASYLLVGDEVIDYSGKLLNLAARLNELARPSGIVVDGNYQKEIIPKKVRKQFSSKSVYLRGIAEEVPIHVYISEQVCVPDSALYPLREPDWKLYEENLSAEKVLAMQSHGTYSMWLPSMPQHPSRIIAECSCPSEVEGNNVTQRLEDVHQSVDANGHKISFPLKSVQEWIKAIKVNAKAKIFFRVHYTPKPKPRKSKRS